MTSFFGIDNFFYNGALRKYVGIFGSIFSDMYIQRTSDDGKKVDTIKVPIKYGNGNMYLKVAQDGSRETTKVSRILPGMAFELDTLYKDVERKTSPNNIINQVGYDSDGTRHYQFNRIPYNIIFTLKIHTKNIDDMLQILEQIAPVFDGNLSITLEDTQNNVNNNQNIILKMDEIKIVDNYEEEMKSRLIECDISFEMKAFLYKRTMTAHVIKEVDIYHALSEFDVITPSTPIDLVVNDQYPLTGKQLIMPKISDAEKLLFSAFGVATEEAATGTTVKVRKTRKGN
jgi:hypothetical protein